MLNMIMMVSTEQSLGASIEDYTGTIWWIAVIGGVFLGFGLTSLLMWKNLVPTTVRYVIGIGGVLQFLALSIFNHYVLTEDTEMIHSAIEQNIHENFVVDAVEVVEFTKDDVTTAEVALEVDNTEMTVQMTYSEHNDAMVPLADGSTSDVDVVEGSTMESIQEDNS